MLLQAAAQYAPDVPILIVVTKKDGFEGGKVTEARRVLKQQGKPVTFKAADAYLSTQRNS